jgi:serine/threonine protein phosphatase PrpC
MGAPKLEPAQAIPGVEPPVDGTLQLLPGRVTILGEDGRMQEIRFVRVPGSPPEVTFGRSSGPAHRHVQLESPTVSRLHARLRFDGGGWILSNLSRTNPTRLNGQPLAGESVEHPVRDGDRIEMGDLTLEFHQPETQDRLPMRSSWASEIGLRSTNQDAVAVRTLPERKELAAVCDGVGSHKAGARASHTAIEAVVQALSDRKDLPTAIRAANEAVRQEARSDGSLKGMATTMVALLREEDHYWVGNVGDSRAYRIDASGIRQITRDHSFIAEALRSGEMSRDEAERSPWRNAITRNLGGEADVEVDQFGPFSTAEPHVVVLCTDGLHGVLSEADLERTVREAGQIREVARALCDEAIRRGGKDNVTVAALAFGGGIAWPGTPP